MTLNRTLYLLLLLASPLFSVAQQGVTKIQFINNCPDKKFTALSFFVDGGMVSNIDFRHSGNFVDVPSNVPITIAVSDQGGTINDTFYSVTTTLSPALPHEVYVCVANGIESTTGYTPAPPFTLSFYNLGRQMSNTPGNTDVLFAHGSTDAGKYDFRTGTKILGKDISYGQFSQTYAEMPSTDFPIRLTNSSGSKKEGTYEAPFSTSDFSGKPAVIVLSGFKNPANNSNGPAFGLWAATNMAGPLIELQMTAPEALSRLQLVHNSADTIADMVDVYINDKLTYNDMPFRSNTAFIDLIAKVPTKISIGRKNTASVADTFFSITTTFDSARTYQAIVGGVKSTTYKPAGRPFGVTLLLNAREESGLSGNTDIVVHNGSIDVPDFDLKEGTTPWATNLFYREFDPYISVPTQDYLVLATKTGKTDTINLYEAKLQTWNMQGKAATIMASGFYDTAKNKLSPLFDFYITNPDGGMMTRLPIKVIDPTENIAKVNSLTFSLWPNPASSELYISGLKQPSVASAEIIDITGKTLHTQYGMPNNKVETGTLPTGTYLLKITDAGRTGYQKFIKQ